MQSGYEIIQGNALDELRKLPAGHAYTCVTSPPYWALRDYGIEPSIWETSISDPNCEHEWEMFEVKSGQRGGTNNPLFGAFNGDTHISSVNYGFCPCGAWLGTLGLEPTLELFIEHICQIFDEVWRVLKDDGTLWLNLGDCYNGSGGAGGDYSKGGIREGQPKYPGRLNPDLAPKNLLGVPWRIALALQERGWILRSDIIWHKPNPMPAGVTDRPIMAHEYIFLFAKQQKYYYDADSIRVKAKHPVIGKQPPKKTESKEEVTLDGMSMTRAGEITMGAGSRPRGLNDYISTHGRHSHPKGRHPHSVWKVATKPYKGAHFATFPPDLITPCVKAGCPEGGIVLDPFSGTATTGQVALENGRNYCGIEIGDDYIKMAEDRLSQVDKKLGLTDKTEWL